ncbi:MAG: glutaminyl-peptide cyclotransferase [Akkermansiaceae bacterium]|nr:glutaminyl-peptide cyclotransferase [Akkermansiaceae bacterium]MCP5543470.1 glutaminyl-peptide cyclotransferase [Akkermansiaceae bacterium]MCP5546811.1 glutaminyl-peptide cyclotransferase [Akkermansiaceae bacterium]
MRLLLPTLAAALLAACGKPSQLGFKVVSTVEHDANCYTQGLELLDGRMFESGGGYGSSTLREVDPKTGGVLRKRPMARTVFAEGITILNGELWVLTWQEHIAYVFEPDSFKYLRQYKYDGEGWGLTNDGKHLIMSDGSDVIRFIDPDGFKVVRELAVTSSGKTVEEINELEFTPAGIYANIYQTDRIARISPDNGNVTGWLDCSALRKQLPPPHRAEVLNGIALDKKTGRFWITGKLWPRMFEVEITE